ncbi:hypothetical protein AU381_02790 [Sinorhizobium glycinis]|uniref:Uncharacterized protein n=1 Tax=Sinorhizobium glycinis TaxID=1472378 RepID=A0A178XZT8_9HYPH|nr:hypothetical protein AU381_02790 [Sinorhizobium glycinis]
MQVLRAVPEAVSRGFPKKDHEGLSAKLRRQSEALLFEIVTQATQGRISGRLAASLPSMAEALSPMSALH